MERFDKIIDITREINTNLDLDRILQLVVNAIADEIVQADLVGFFIKDNYNPFFYGYVGNNRQIDIKQLHIDPEKDLFAKEILRTKKSLYIADTIEDGRLDPMKVELMQIKSILGVPVIIDNTVFGMVFVHDFGKPMNLSSHEIQTIEGFVNMASVAISNARAFEKSNELLSQQKLLLKVTHSLSKSLSVEDVLETAFKYLQITLSAKEIGIHLYNKKTEKFQAFRLAKTSKIKQEDWKMHHREITLDIHEDNLFKEIIVKKKAVAIYDVLKDSRPNHDACRLFGIKSLLIIPMVAKGNVLGVIALPSMDHNRSYSQAEINLGQTIADVTATALSNALYAKDLDLLVKERTVELQEANLKLENLVKDLKNLIQFKDDLIASLSHELRTPITSIMGSVDILKKEIVGPLNKQQEKLVDMANRATDKLLHRVNELLDFSKLEQGMVSVQLEKTNYLDLVSETVDLIEPLMKKKHQTISMYIDLDKPEIFLDKQRIQQVLFNLLSNAHKFSPEGGEISVSVYKHNNDGIITEVTDYGIGIPKENQEHIFTKFYQANHHKNGTGLGLAISKQLIELHKGEIWFESTEGKGSRFIYSLPERND